MAEPCKVTGKKHKYEWVRDITITRSTYGPNGATHKMSARAEYKCACGQINIGKSKGGL